MLERVGVVADERGRWRRLLAVQQVQEAQSGGRGFRGRRGRLAGGLGLRRAVGKAVAQSAAETAIAVESVANPECRVSDQRDHSYRKDPLGGSDRTCASVVHFEQVDSALLDVLVDVLLCGDGFLRRGRAHR